MCFCLSSDIFYCVSGNIILSALVTVLFCFVFVQFEQILLIWHYHVGRNNSPSLSVWVARTRVQLSCDAINTDVRVKPTVVALGFFDV